MEDKKKVLIVDDQPEITEIVEEFILDKYDDVETITTNNAINALEILGKNIFSLVVSDHHMPGMSGTDFLREVRSQEGPNKDCPFIILTAMQHEVMSELDGAFSNVVVINKVDQMIKIIEETEKYLAN